MSVAVEVVQQLSECRDKAVAGGKAVNLGILIRAGFPVPGGFVVTTDGYRHARGNDLRQGVNGLGEQIRSAYRAIGGGRVAVRSSATAEDMAQASMAGQYETFLDVCDEESLLNAVQCCWASLDSPRTRAYLSEHGIDIALVAMAVVVQRLVPADVAGVLFSANPQSGSRQEMLIEASWGLGESVVSGIVQPDILRLDRATGRVIHATIADKKILVRPEDGQEQPVEESRRRLPCVRSADVEKLWEIGRRAADHFGAPQDLEWAIYKGELFVLQSRPITTLADAEAYEQLLQSTRATLRQWIAEGRGPWVQHNIGETLPHPTPLTWSVIKRFMSGAGGFGEMYKMAGFEPSDKVSRDGFLERIGGKLYMDLSLASEMFFEAYPFKYDLEHVRNDPDASQSPPTIPAGSMTARMAAGRRVGAVNAKLQEMAQTFDRELSGKLIPAFVEWCRQEKKRDLPALSTQELIDLWHEREQRVLGEFAPQSLFPSLIGGMALAELKTFLQEHFWDEDADVLASALASGQTPDKTLRANAEMYKLAKGVVTSERWLEEFGHRAPAEFDLATPRWREQQPELLSMAGRLKDGADPAKLHEDRVKATAARVEALRAKLSRHDAAELNDRIDRARRYLVFREDGKYYLMLGYDLLRDLALEMGRRLEIGADVFQLSQEELFDAVKVGFAPHHLLGERKKLFRAEKRLVLPFVVEEAGIDALGEPPKIESKASHSGLAISSGSATGPARIVFSPQEAGDLGKGYVLVCPSTDPGWTPLFVNAAGLVLECGGTLSHGAVVAREMNIPAVVVPGATSLFKDGEVIGVDGRNGAVSRVADPNASAVLPSDALEYESAVPTPKKVNPDDTRISPKLVPPIASQRERSAAKLRNICLVVWGVYLLGIFLLPENWVYGPSLAILDFFLWPVVRLFGKPATVAIVAGGLAALTMLLQWHLTDNTRLVEAKRRAAILSSRASELPAGSPRRLAMMALAGPVQTRVFAAAMLPLAILLGPMVMTFYWLPARIDPTSWNAAPGRPVELVATIDSDFRQPITISAGPGFNVTNTTRTLAPIRETLERIQAEYQKPTDLSAMPWDVVEAAQEARAQKTAELQNYINAGLPPQSLVWQLGPDAGKAGRFPVTVSAPDVAPITAYVVLGDTYPPAAKEVEGDAKSPLKSVKLVYKPMEGHPPELWPALSHIKPSDSEHRWWWPADWLMIYLLAYLPIMFGLRWLLKVA